MNKVSLVFLSSVSENLSRCWCFVAGILSVALDKIFAAPGLDCGACFTAEFQHMLLPSTFFIAYHWDLSGMWPVSSCIVFALSTSVIPGKCAFHYSIFH